MSSPLEQTTHGGILVVEGLAAVRRRPAMYIGGEEEGHTWHARLFELVVAGLASDTPAPTEVRVLVRAEGVVTVASDGEPLPITPHRRGSELTSHPELYPHFSQLPAGTHGLRSALQGGAIINALSEWLVVHTMHGGDCYRIVFSRGMIATLIHRTFHAHPRGKLWLTYRPDATILGNASLTVAEAREVVERVAAKTPGVRVVVEDRTKEKVDWS